MNFIIVCISMTSSTKIGGGGEFFCLCWFVSVSASVDSSIAYLFKMVLPQRR